MTSPILTYEQSQEALLDDFVVTISRIPLGLETQNRIREAYDDRSIHVDNTTGSIWFHVEVRSTREVTAIAVFAADSLVVRCDTIEVMPKYRRRGVATALYRIASREFAAPVVPSGVLSSEASAFWGENTQISWS